MSGPRSAEQAGQVAVQLLQRSLRGHRAAVHRECRRAAVIAAVIWRRWHVGPWQWKCKHVRWFLEHGMNQYRGWTQYRYWLTLERLLKAIEKIGDWRAHLNGPWCLPQEHRRRSRSPVVCHANRFTFDEPDECLRCLDRVRRKSPYPGGRSGP